MNRLVSVIIPACNEEKYLERTLGSVEENKKSYPRIETIVVCDSCTDKTKSVAERFDAKIYSINARKPSTAKNFGAKHSRANYYIFLDADTTISENAVLDIMKALVKANVVGTLKVRPYPKKPFASLLMFLKNLSFRLHLYPGSNGLIFCRKELFHQAGCFDDRLHRYEDGDFTRKAVKIGKYSFITTSEVETSIRRFEKLGYFRVMFFWVKVYLQHRKGISNNGKYPIIR